PYVKDPKAADTVVHSAASQQLALRAAHEAIVLLKNDTVSGRQTGLLPLNASSIGTLAVIGPNAKEVKALRSRYGPADFEVKNVYEGIRDALPASVKLLYAKGINHTDPHWPQSDVEEFPLTTPEQQAIDSAVDVAKQADVVVMVLGDNGNTVGESHSRVSMN